MKRCYKCKDIKLYLDFFKDKTQSDGYKSLCKDCHNKYLREYRQKNRDKLLEYKRQYRAENDDKIKNYRRLTRERTKEWNKEYYILNKDRIRFYSIKRKYNLTKTEYLHLVDIQEGLCAICKKLDKDGMLNVDHNHQTGKVRGLLCGLCNAFIGRIDDNAFIAKTLIDYLGDA